MLRGGLLQMKGIQGLVQRGPGKVEFVKNLEELFNFKPEKGQLLVNVRYAPMNPSDFYFFKNVYYDKKPFPCIPGFEGVGVVADAGDDAHKHLVGKPCVFITLSPDFGSYATHTITSVKNTVILDVLPNQEHFEFLINPITALGLLEEAQKHGAKAFVQNGASTSVGKLVLFFNQRRYKLDSVNIVRNMKHREELMKLGAGVVLDSSSSDFWPQIEKVIQSYQTTAAFDCQCGKSGGQLFNLLPHHSIQWVYGILDLKPMEGIDGSQLIFTSKQIRGFHLVHNFLKFKDLGLFHQEINDVAKHFQQAPGVKVFDVEHFQDAFKYFPSKKEKLLFRLSV